MCVCVSERERESGYSFSVLCVCVSVCVRVPITLSLYGCVPLMHAWMCVRMKPVCVYSVWVTAVIQTRGADVCCCSCGLIHWLEINAWEWTRRPADASQDFIKTIMFKSKTSHVIALERADCNKGCLSYFWHCWPHFWLTSLDLFERTDSRFCHLLLWEGLLCLCVTSHMSALCKQSTLFFFSHLCPNGLNQP